MISVSLGQVCKEGVFQLLIYKNNVYWSRLKEKVLYTIAL